VAAVEDPEQQLEWEQRQRVPAAIAAALAGLLGLGGVLWSQAIFRDAPQAGFLEALGQAAEPGPIGRAPSVRTAFFEFINDHATTILAASVVQAIGMLALGWAVTYLALATRARRPELAKPFVYAAFVGAVLTAVSVVLNVVGLDTAVSRFLDGPRTVDAARDVSGESLRVAAQLIGLVAQLALGVGLVMVALNAMRAGLLTRFLGVLGIITGALVVIPLGPVPVVQSFWLLALALLFVGRLPSGVPPAWRTGKAEPWPTQQPRRPPAKEPEPEPAPAGRPHPASKKRKKRKRRA
jgi:hypothetical protein